MRCQNACAWASVTHQHSVSHSQHMNWRWRRVGVMTVEMARPSARIKMGSCLKVRHDGRVTVTRSLTGFSPVHLAAGWRDRWWKCDDHRTAPTRSTASASLPDSPCRPLAIHKACRNSGGLDFFFLICSVQLKQFILFSPTKRWSSPFKQMQTRGCCSYWMELLKMN